MFRKSKLFFIIAETPLHPGSGSELGIVDLPIQRERHTGYPKIEGSGIKGSIREAFENSNQKIRINSQEINVNDTQLISFVFGPEKGEEHAGAIAFIDARILLFPVKSLKGVFGWITCPQVLERFKDDMIIANQAENLRVSNFSNLANTYPQNSNLVLSSKVVLEEYAFSVEPKEETTKLAKWLTGKIFPQKGDNDPYKYWREKLEKDLVILSDDDFKEFVSSSTEVITRTKIDAAKGTVAPGGLWTEEYLPQDTILYSLAMASPVRVDKDDEKGVLKADTPEQEAEKVIEFFTNGCPEILQIGGNQTLGKGIVRIQFFEQQEAENG